MDGGRDPGNVITAAGVRDMLLGTGAATPVQPPGGALPRGPRRVPGRWLRCHNCDRTFPYCITSDWPGAFARSMSHPDGWTAAVEALKARTGRDSVNLCDSCVRVLDAPAPVAPLQLGMEF